MTEAVAKAYQERLVWVDRILRMKARVFFTGAVLFFMTVHQFWDASKEQHRA